MKEEIRKEESAPSNQMDTSWNVKTGAVYIKICGVQQMEHKCAKKKKVQEQLAG